MSKFSEVFQKLVVETLQNAYQLILQLAPKLVFAAIILLIGLVCALLIRKITSKILKALGVDVLSEKTGLKSFLEKGEVHKNLSAIAGQALYWLVIFSTLVMVFDTLELNIISNLLHQILSYLPKVIVALVILSLGIFLSQIVNNFIQTSSRLANIPFPNLLGKGSQYLLIGLAVITGLEYLDLPLDHLIEYFMIVFLLIPSVLFLILLIGGRDTLASVIAGRIVTKEYKRGDLISFGSTTGTIESIGLISTKVKNDQGLVIIPNQELTTQRIEVKTAGQI